MAMSTGAKIGIAAGITAALAGLGAALAGGKPAPLRGSGPQRRLPPAGPMNGGLQGGGFGARAKKPCGCGR